MARPPAPARRHPGPGHLMEEPETAADPARTPPTRLTPWTGRGGGAGAGAPLGGAGAALNRPERLVRMRSVIGEVLGALDYVHGRGFVHRDLKPSNIMVDDARRARIMDFGLVKQLTDASPSPSNRVVGTYRYMSPEQAPAATWTAAPTSTASASSSTSSWSGRPPSRAVPGRALAGDPTTSRRHPGDEPRRRPDAGGRGGAAACARSRRRASRAPQRCARRRSCSAVYAVDGAGLSHDRVPRSDQIHVRVAVSTPRRFPVVRLAKDPAVLHRGRPSPARGTGVAASCLSSVRYSAAGSRCPRPAAPRARPPTPSSPR